MKKLLTLILALGLVIGLAGVSLGASDSFQITANIIRPLEITTVNNIDFGTISDLSSGTNYTESATMTISGADGEAYEVDIPGSVTITEANDSTKELTVGLAVINKEDISGNTANFDVEATISGDENSDATTLEGSYSKSVTMTVTYQN